MRAKCVQECWDGDALNGWGGKGALYVSSFEYDISPDSPVAMHFVDPDTGKYLKEPLKKRQTYGSQDDEGDLKQMLAQALKMNAELMETLKGIAINAQGDAALNKIIESSAKKTK